MTFNLRDQPVNPSPLGPSIRRDHNTSLSSVWISHLPESKREGFKEFLFNASRDPALVRLLQIIQEKRDSLESSERHSKIYENPSWAYLQAHNNGMRQALKLIEDLLSFVKE